MGSAQSWLLCVEIVFECVMFTFRYEDKVKLDTLSPPQSNLFLFSNRLYFACIQRRIQTLSEVIQVVFTLLCSRSRCTFLVQ